MNDFCVITCYYNPVGYRSKRENYELFVAGLEKSGISPLTVECVFDSQEFDLLESPHVMRLRSQSVLWQRERLVNLAVATLPESVRFVAWVDCDLIFSNPRWIFEAKQLLQKVLVVQLYERCIRLPRGSREYAGDGKSSVSFGAVTTRRPEVLLPGSVEKHGTTGYAWAARREVFDVAGLYEGAIVGGADDYTAHAVYGDFESECVARKMQYDPVLMRHFREWGERFHSVVQGKIGFVRGDILHLWHGDLQHRQYLDRHEMLGRLGYDPYRDICSSPGMPLEWSSCASDNLRAWIYDYFVNRREDE